MTTPNLDGIIDERSNDEIHSGQIRMAYRLADHHTDKLLHVHGIGWHHWDGHRWAYDDSGAARRAVVNILKKALKESLDNDKLRKDVGKCESHNGITGVLGVAANLKPFAATVRDLDADPYLLNTASGTLDLRTLELRPASPADRITKVTAAAYDPDAKPGDWHRFLARVLPDEPVRAYVQRYAGVALLGEIFEHVLSIWTGTGANGKGSAIYGLSWALGDYACAAEPELLMHRDGAHPTGEMDLMGKRLVVVTETDEGRRFAEATMKRLTGGDAIRARRMRQDFIEFEPSHTTILVTNHLPAVCGDDPAVWRRLRVVPFDVVIPEDERAPDGELKERLRQCAEEILTWCVNGWAEYRRIGLAEPDAVLSRTSEYREDSDAVARFITDECLTDSPVNKSTTQRLFAAWQQWRQREGGVPELSSKAFGKSLDRHGYPVTNRDAQGRWRDAIAVRPTDHGSSQ
jgi:putative DNA primase/helicase